MSRSLAIAPVPRHAVSVTGGKGGVGKSTIALNIAVACAGQRARTLMVDTGLGTADLNLMLGIAPQHTMLDALGGMPVERVLADAHGITLLPALNGSYALSTIGPAMQRRLIDLVDSLASRFDTLVVDVAAGIGQVQTAIAGATAQTLVVVNPDALSIASAYACLKVLATEQGLRHAYIVPNRVKSQLQVAEITGSIEMLVGRFLDLEITALPAIPCDPTVAEAAELGVPLLVHAPDAPAARAIRALVRALGAAPTSRATPWLRSLPLSRGESR
jgi:flagellar biosynthesis protein FlhG